jgi:hypothetical protein
MPREYPEWDWTDEARDALRNQLDAAMYGDLPPATAVNDLVGLVGRDGLIAALSGTTDRGTREWRNARDNLSRWRRGARHPSAASQQRLRGAGQAHRRSEIRQSRRAHVRYTATFRTSPQRRPWEGWADADLTGPDLDDFMAAHEAGDDELAAQIVSDAYGLDPGFVLGIDGLSSFEVDW